MYTWPPPIMSRAHPAQGLRGGYSPTRHPMMPFHHHYAHGPMPDAERSNSPHIQQKHAEALRPLIELIKWYPQFAHNAKNYLLTLDLPNMDEDSVEVTASENVVSIKGTVKDEESWRTQDGGAYRSVSSSAVTRSYATPGPILASKVTSR